MQVRKVLDLLKGWAGKDMPYEKARQSAAESLIQLGKPELALEVLNARNSSLRDEQLRALALAKTRDAGKIAEATGLLESLWDTHPDAETGGLLGGRYKQQWLSTQAAALLQRSHEVYLAAFELGHEFYPGINAAATALWLGQADTSRVLATQVLQSLAAVPLGARDVWYHATEGEARLLLGDVVVAKTCYRRAVRLCEYAPETVATMRSQAQENLARMGLDRNEFALVFS
jgi:tetratricopeptide (TPR) repeat protein